MKPKITVITTVLNGEPYANKGVPSILSQIYRDFEYILVDDGSTDGTLEILHQFALQDDRIRVLNPGRLGRVRALNYAVQQANGTYIANQDFDDISYPERLMMQVEFLNAHPRVGVVGSYYLLDDTERNEKYIRVPPTVHSDLVRELSRRIPICHTLATFRKQAWQDAGGYPTFENTGEDLALWIAMVKCGWQLANIPIMLGEHYEHKKSFFHNSIKQRKRQNEMAQLQLMAIRQLNLPLWMLIYPLGRSFYLYLPNVFKRILRRTVGRSKERDITLLV